MRSFCFWSSPLRLGSRNKSEPAVDQTGGSLHCCGRPPSVSRGPGLSRYHCIGCARVLVERFGSRAHLMTCMNDVEYLLRLYEKFQKQIKILTLLLYFPML